jgi:peptidyl-prolyl cis-trans isomerase B (cyclophilin B)
MAKNKNYKYNANAAKEAAALAAARKKKKTVISIIITLLVLAIIGGCVTAIVLALRPADYCEFYADREVDPEDVTYVELKVKGYKNPIVILLDESVAPITVKNFVSLVEKGFYDGLTFHRIIKDFMMQGGDDSHLPADKQAASIKGEFLSNGHYNELKHKRGVISMARATDPNSAASGFFICDADKSHLDGDYASFGYVLSGMHTVDKIINRATKHVVGDNGIIPDKSHQPVIEYIRVLDGYKAK